MRTFDGMVGESRIMEELYAEIAQVASVDLTVLVTGESGTGKELAARSIHRRSGRRPGPFVAVNTGAIPPDLVASELFGHERGAFTGAVGTRRGRFELASSGTLFLDEVSAMDQHTQITLLRVLESRRFQRVGGEQSIPTDARVIAATNEELGQAVAEGRFREDLYHRMNVLALRVPSLRERDGDIELLADYFLDRYRREFGRPARQFHRETLACMRRYSWPGNVRELENAVMRMVITAGSKTLTADKLPPAVRAKETPPSVRIEIGSTIEQAERALIRETLRELEGNRTAAAGILGISRKSLYNKMKQYQISL